MDTVNMIAATDGSSPNRLTGDEIYQVSVLHAKEQNTFRQRSVPSAAMACAFSRSLVQADLPQVGSRG